MRRLVFRIVIAVLATVFLIEGSVYGILAKQVWDRNHPMYRGITKINHFDPSNEWEQVCLGYWDLEVQRRFPTAVIIGGHGGDVLGQWMMIDEATRRPLLIKQVVKDVQALYPNRTIVILSCNPDGLQLHNLPNVYYATESVWMCPERFFGVIQREHPEAGTPPELTTDPAVGSIFEFVEAL